LRPRRKTSSHLNATALRVPAHRGLGNATEKKKKRLLLIIRWARISVIAVAGKGTFNALARASSLPAFGSVQAESIEAKNSRRDGKESPKDLLKTVAAVPPTSGWALSLRS